MFLEISGRLSVSLELGQIYLLGKRINGDRRKSENFIELDEENISKRHCVIETSHNEEAFVFDLFSFKGTLLNNKLLKSLEKTLLKNGDILKAGDIEIKYIHEGHELSCDSSGFLEVQKNTSDIIASSPESASQVQNRLKNSDDHKFLMPMRPSTSFSSRRSDSFTIPETQYCKSRNSLNGSKLSIDENIPDKKTDGRIQFNFGNQDTFEDDDLCIPETQELVPVDGISCTQHQPKLNGILNEERSTLENENISNGSQFRICTQDYNEGFGEEETVGSLHSQIIPLIKHSPVMINKTLERSNTNSRNQSSLDQTEKEMSSLKWPNTNTDQETTELRADCLTPDIFEFEAVNNKEDNENADKSSTQQTPNVLVEDEEDLLPTQCLPPVLKQVEEKKIFNEIEKPCLEKEAEEVLTLSDKENMCPSRSDPIADMPPTQIFEVRSHTSISHSNSISSAIKFNNLQGHKSSSHSVLNLEPDEEDDLLTQAFLQPKIASARSSNKNLLTTCFNSTLLDDKCTEKTPATFFAELEKNPLKQMTTSSSDVFKKPDRDLSILKKTSSASSTASESDVDLLMCTPKFIKDSLSLESSEDLRKHILAVKNRHLFGDDTEEEDDEEKNLVKLINVPKNSLDFDQLLPHLNKKSEGGTEKQDDHKEAQKMYKFNISFGKEQDDNQSNSLTSKLSSYSRDERHAARDKGREVLVRKEKTKTKSDYKATTKRQEKMLEKEAEHKEKKKEVNKRRRGKKNENEQKEKDEKQLSSNKTEDIQKNNQVQVAAISENKSDSKPEGTARLRKRQISDKSVKQEPQSGNGQQITPAKRLTRSKSRLEEMSTFSNKERKEDDSDNVPTQPIVKITRSRSKSKQNAAHDASSNTSAKTNESKKNKIEQNHSPNLNTGTKKTERKRRAEAPTAARPANIESKRLKSLESPTSPSASITISITNVDQELIKELMKNAKGLWNIAPNAADSDILVMDKPLRTFKFLLAMARGIPIVTSEYLKKLNKSKSVEEVSLKDYHFVDNEFEKKYKFSLLKSEQAAKKQKMFKDYEFLMTASILPIPQEIKAIIEAAGGYVHHKNPPEAKENQKLYLVTAREDKKDWHKYRRLNKNIIIVSTEAIMSAIMSQSSERMRSFTLA